MPAGRFTSLPMAFDYWKTIDVCIANDPGRTTGGLKNRASVGRPRALAMQASINPPRFGARKVYNLGTYPTAQLLGKLAVVPGAFRKSLVIPPMQLRNE